MPHDISFENEGSGVVLKMKGRVSGAEVLEVVRSMYDQDPECLLRYQIADFSDATEFIVSEEELRAVAFLDQQASLENPDQIVAMVGSAEFFKGADKRYAIYADVWAGFETQLFETMAEARNWIASKYPDLNPD